MLIFKSARNRGVAFAANGLRGDAARHRFGLEEGERVEIDAKLVVSAVANPRFGVYGASEMIMEVGSFGHTHEKLAKFERILADGFESAGSALLADGSGGDCRHGGRPFELLTVRRIEPGMVKKKQNRKALQ